MQPAGYSFGWGSGDGTTEIKGPSVISPCQSTLKVKLKRQGQLLFWRDTPASGLGQS